MPPRSPLPPGIDPGYITRMHQRGKRDADGNIDILDYIKNNPGPATDRFIEANVQLDTGSLEADEDSVCDHFDFSSLELRKGVTWKVELIWQSSVDEIMNVDQLKKSTTVHINDRRRFIDSLDVPCFGLHAFRLVCCTADAGRRSIRRFDGIDNFPSPEILSRFLKLCIAKPMPLFHIFLPETIVLSATFGGLDITMAALFLSSLPPPFNWRIACFEFDNPLPSFPTSSSLLERLLHSANVAISSGDAALAQGDRKKAIEAFKHALSQRSSVMCLPESQSRVEEVKGPIAECYRKLSTTYLLLGAGRNPVLGVREAMNLVDISREDLKAFLLLSRAYQAAVKVEEAYTVLWWTHRSLQFPRDDFLLQYLRENRDQLSNRELSKEERHLGGWLAYFLPVRKAPPRW